MTEIEALKLAYRRTFGTDDGQRVIADLRKRLRFEQTTHVPGDPNESAFLEGQRYAYLLIAGMLVEEREKVRTTK
jgi:hypothetical protein